MELSTQQGQCVKHVVSAIKSGKSNFDAQAMFGSDSPPTQLVRIDGFAGTGKSTILPFILDDLGFDPKTVGFVAPTGKAAKVMRTKLRDQKYANADARTIHSAIYRAKPAPVSKLEADLAAAG